MSLPRVRRPQALRGWFGKGDGAPCALAFPAVSGGLGDGALGSIPAQVAGVRMRAFRGRQRSRSRARAEGAYGGTCVRAGGVRPRGNLQRFLVRQGHCPSNFHFIQLKPLRDVGVFTKPAIKFGGIVNLRGTKIGDD